MSGLQGGMNSARSGLDGYSRQTGAIAGNLANTGTVAGKGVSVEFSSVLAGDTTGGITSFNVNHIDVQGILENSQNPHDLAISGNGFFVVGRLDSITGQVLEYRYTRDGRFTPDNNGNLQGVSGWHLLGWGTDAAGNKPSGLVGDVTELVPIKVSQNGGYFKETTIVSNGSILAANAPLGKTESINTKIVDSLGGSHVMIMTWEKVNLTPAQWKLSVSIADATSVTNDNTGNAYETFVEFDGSGNIAKYADTQAALATSTDTAPSPMTIVWDTVALQSNPNNSHITLNIAATRQEGTSFNPAIVTSNGKEYGQFNSVSYDDEGVVSANYSNGEAVKIFRIALASFNSPNGLKPKASGLYVETNDSGRYVLRDPKSSGMGSVISGATESSNVDAAKEFTDLISAQTGYNMNAKSIQVINEMLRTLTNII